jgi:predicted nuclease of predicted toxin-antitoxin system
MKFLVDEQLPPSLARWLTAQRHDAVRVHEVLSRPAADRAIAIWAREHGCVVVSKDADFGRLAGGDPPLQILRVTSGNARTPRLLALSMLN